MNALEKIVMIEDVVRKHSKARVACFNVEQIKTLSTQDVLLILNSYLRKNKLTDSIEIEAIIEEVETELKKPRIRRVFAKDIYTNPLIRNWFRIEKTYVCSENFSCDGFIIEKDEVVEIEKFINGIDYVALPHFALIKESDFKKYFKQIELF